MPPTGLSLWLHGRFHNGSENMYPNVPMGVDEFDLVNGSFRRRNGSLVVLESGSEATKMSEELEDMEALTRIDGHVQRLADALNHMAVEMGKQSTKVDNMSSALSAGSAKGDALEARVRELEKGQTRALTLIAIASAALATLAPYLIKALG